MVGGDGQMSMVGWQVEQPITVVVRDGSGSPMTGVRVRFHAETGGGLAWPVVDETDALGRGSTRWRLGSSAGPQTLTASAEQASVTFSASALAPGQGELLVVHGTLGPLRGAILSADDGTYGFAMSGLTTDTLVDVPPVQSPGREIVLLGHDNRPVIVAPSWTSGADTVHVTMQPPVAIDFHFDVQDGDYALLVAQMERQIDVMEGVWERDAVGVRVGRVTFEDNSGSGPVHISSSGICPSTLATRIEAAIVTTLDSGTYWGWGCTTGYIFLTGPEMGLAAALYMLAHEVGHTFALAHTLEGVMKPNPPQSFMTAGEAFRANFNRYSVLNSIFDAQPTELQRACGAGDVCLPQTYDFPEDS